MDTEVLDAVRVNFLVCKDALETYKVHVTDSPARISSRLSSVFNANRARTKIQIKGFHVSKGEFVDALKPKGEVSLNLMGLCCGAIMCEWENSKRIILDQGIIRELLKPGHECEHPVLAAKFKKLGSDDWEEVFIPILKNSHWVLFIVNLLTDKVFFHDSANVLSEDHNPHLEIWENLAGNLEESYCSAKRKTLGIPTFKCIYPATKIQTNNHDCGYHVIQIMECYKTEDVVCHSKNKTMQPYRKYLSHILIYHRFNDLNPLRPGLRAEAP